MAPTKAASRNRREADYSQIGVAGRKTGVTLKDTGIRDEHGLEPIDGIFSSPEKGSPVRKANGNGNGHGNSTLTDGEMEIGESTIAEPMEVLSARRPHLPPPRARSPIKTSLGSSPRRSVGPTSSPTRARNSTPSRSPSQRAAMARISTEDAQPSLTAPSREPNGRPLSSPPAPKRGRPKLSAKKSRKRPFELSTEEEENDEDTGEAVAMASDGGVEVPPVDDMPTFNGDESMQLLQDESVGLANTEPDSTLANEETTLDQSLEVPSKPKRGRPKKNKEDTSQLLITASPQEPDVTPQDIQTTSHLVQATSPQTRPVESLDNDEAPKPRRGRPAKPKPEVYREPEVVIEDGPSKPAKRAKTTSAPDSSAANRRPPPSQRDPNATIKSSQENKRDISVEKSEVKKRGPKGKKEQQKEPDQVPVEGKGKTKAKAKSNENTPLTSPPPFLPRPAVPSLPERGKPKPRSLTILRSETPGEDTGAKYTRSGRTSVKPLAFWRNEKLIFGDTRSDGTRLSLAGIKEVLRGEEIEDSRPRPRRKRGAPKKRSAKRPVEMIEEVDENMEEWEQDPGALEAEVLQWDPITQRGMEDAHEQVELAIAPKGLEALVKEVRGQSFHYAKTVTLPFFHSGMVDIPAQGEKRQKNSRKNHMVFWVFAGRVEVDVSGNTFSVGRGGMWQVPRGNWYSLRNPFSDPVRVFFAQGCYMMEEEVEFEDEEVGEAGGSGGSGGVEVGEGEEANLETEEVEDGVAIVAE